MNTIKFNNVSFEVDSYNKNTYFSGDSVSSTASCTIFASDITALNTVAEGEITSIQIYHNEELIYDLQNITAHIDNMSEYLNNDRISININMTF